MPAHRPELEPTLDLWFSSAELLDDEPDSSAWAQAEPLAEELELGCDELEIPAAERTPALPTEAWNLFAVTRSPLRQAIAAAAAFLPLMLTAEPVLAAAPPEGSVDAPIEGPAPAPVEEPAETPAASTAAPAIEASAVVTPASIYDALRDRRVVLSLVDGSSFRGTVLSATDSVLVCARESDGLMVLINIAELTAVHVEGLPDDPAKPKQPNGQGLIVLGSIATAIGGALTIAGVGVAGACAANSYYDYTYFCPYITLPLGAVGVANLAAGIPMLVTGLRRRAAAREAERPAVSAFVLPGRNGVMGGVGLRF
jgi:hypothetical protein